MIGYKEILDKMKGAAIKGTLAHAHIIFGEDGSGKSMVAKTLGRIILNPENPDTKERDVDLKEIRLKGKSIGVDEVREIVTEASYRPFIGDKKVIIIYDGDKMTIQAQNALLKTIEEPPNGVFFIILSESKDALLPTIRSRCQNLRLYPLSREEMKEYINKNHKVPEDKIGELVAISQGIPGKVDDFLNDEKIRQRLDSMLTLLELHSKILSIRDRNNAYILIMNKIIKEDPENYFEEFINLLRDMAVVRTGRLYKNIIFLYNEKRVEEIAQRFTLTQINNLIDILSEGLDLLAPGRNINKETVVDYVLLKILEEKK